MNIRFCSTHLPFIVFMLYSLVQIPSCGILSPVFYLPHGPLTLKHCFCVCLNSLFTPYVVETSNALEIKRQPATDGHKTRDNLERQPRGLRGLRGTRRTRGRDNKWCPKVSVGGEDVPRDVVNVMSRQD